MPKKWYYFYAPYNKSLKIGADSVKSEVRVGERITQESHVISFSIGLFKTCVLKEATVVRECDEFKLDRIKEITEEAVGEIMKAQAAVMGIFSQVAMPAKTNPEAEDPAPTLEPEASTTQE